MCYYEISINIKENLEMIKKHYLNKDGSRWFIKINNKSDELNKLNMLHFFTFPYYVVFDEDTGMEETYSSLKELKEGEE